MEKRVKYRNVYYDLIFDNVGELIKVNVASPNTKMTTKHSKFFKRNQHKIYNNVPMMYVEYKNKHSENKLNHFGNFVEDCVSPFMVLGCWMICFLPIIGLLYILVKTCKVFWVL